MQELICRCDWCGARVEGPGDLQRPEYVLPFKDGEPRHRLWNHPDELCALCFRVLDETLRGVYCSLQAMFAEGAAPPSFLVPEDALAEYDMAGKEGSEDWKTHRNVVLDALQRGRESFLLLQGIFSAVCCTNDVRTGTRSARMLAVLEGTGYNEVDCQEPAFCGVPGGEWNGEKCVPCMVHDMIEELRELVKKEQQ